MRQHMKDHALSRLVAKGRPLVIAHRGASATSPENTIPAFLSGIAFGADIIEMDVHLTADGEIVVCHDATVDRTTDGTGRIAQMTLSRLKELDAGFRHSTDGGGTFPFRGKGITIPTLEEALNAVSGHPVIIEVKASTAQMAQRLVEIMRELNAFNSVSVEVFSMKGKTARYLRKLEPRLATGHSALEIVRFMILSRLRMSRLFRRAGFAIAVPPRRKRTTVLTKSLVGAAQKRGIPVFVWTVNEKTQMERILDLGVEGIFTDRPRLLRTLVDSTRWDRPRLGT